MSSVNKVLLIGNLGNDPEMRYTTNGTPVMSFSMATSEKWTADGGEKKERTTWHKIVVFGKQAETLVKLELGKGKKVYVEGRLRNDEYTDKAGEKRRSTTINARSVQLL